MYNYGNGGGGSPSDFYGQEQARFQAYQNLYARNNGVVSGGSDSSPFLNASMAGNQSSSSSSSAPPSITINTQTPQYTFTQQPQQQPQIQWPQMPQIQWPQLPPFPQMPQMPQMPQQQQQQQRQQQQPQQDPNMVKVWDNRTGQWGTAPINPVGSTNHGNPFSMNYNNNNIAGGSSASNNVGGAGLGMNNWIR